MPRAAARRTPHAARSTKHEARSTKHEARRAAPRLPG
ncbi:succinylglutamate desuccinylase [Burkholderia pseudomallei]|nr:succinylglutamate desuccinylase [Burkholderia pseudomallei]